MLSDVEDLLEPADDGIAGPLTSCQLHRQISKMQTASHTDRRAVQTIFKGKVVYSSLCKCLTTTGTRVPHGITQCYLPPGRGDIPTFTPAKAGTRFGDPGGCKAELTWLVG